MQTSLINKSIEETKEIIPVWIQRWGCSISEAVIDNPCCYFRIPDIDGFIGYLHVSKYAIVIGDPICPRKDAFQLALAFSRYCEDQKLEVIYLVASEWFAKWLIQNTSKIMIEVGEELIFNPSEDVTEGHKASKLRNKVRHVQNLGLQVHEYLSNDPKIEKEIQEVGTAWLKERKGPQIYLADLNFFENRSGKRWFYLEDQGRILGMILLCRLEAHDGWLLKFLVMAPENPRGASAFLMLSVLEKLKQENCHYLTYGMVPLEVLGEIKGLSSFSTWFAHKVFKFCSWFFKLEQKKTFWKQFHPNSKPTYVLFSHSKIGFTEVKSIMKALNTH